MPAPYTFPWGLHPLDPMVSEEIQRRIKDYGINPVQNPTNENPYTGPRTAWIRVFSNGICASANENIRNNGFVMGGTEGFDESYGFGIDNKITIGVDCYGNKHEISANPTSPSLGVATDLPNRPPPTIVSLDSEFSGGNNTGFNATCRKTKISWKCFSLSQLEYLAPFFLTPRITVLAEWGWNTVSPSSLVDLSNTEGLYAIFKGEKSAIYDRIKNSHGNYDLAFGFITDYGYTMNDFGGYDCFTTITNPNYLTEGKAYHNRQDTKSNPSDPSGSIKLKDFTEFVFDDMDNIVISTETSWFSKKNKVDTVTVSNVSFVSGSARPSGKVFKDENDQWVRMDMVADIVNRFFSKGMLDPNNKETGVQIGVLDINKTPISAHPAIKSVSPNFIIPNQYAPRFVAADPDSKKEQKNSRLSELKQVGNLPQSSNKSPQGEYFSLFPEILDVIKEHQFIDEYDDLVLALATSNAKPKHGSFPQLISYNEGEKKTNYPKPGYWGYLEDIFVSIKYFKELVQKHDTLLKLLEELLQGISEATCNVAKLQLKPDTSGGTKFYVIDHNFTPVGDRESAEDLTRFVMNANNYAFMKNASFDVKISSEMVNQMVMQSASRKPLPQGYGTATYDPVSMKYSIFSRGDRMFDRGVYTPKQTEESNKSNTDKKFSRMFDKENGDFYVYEYKSPVKKRIPNPRYVEIPRNIPTYGAPGGMLGRGMMPEPEFIVINEPVQKFILAETSNTFLKTILMGIKTAQNATYVSNGLMPGTIFKMEFLGISGITFLSQFTLDHVPNLYDYTNAVWQISDVKHRVENKIWTTNISAQARPLVTLKK